MKNIRVLVVDDSAYNRRTITKMLNGMEGVEVVGYAADGEEGIRKIISLSPDLITLDLEMPKMDGFTMLRIVMTTCPTPVIVVSSQSKCEGVFKALELGAVDFVVKPNSIISDELLKIRDDLQVKVKNVFTMNMAGVKRREIISSADFLLKNKKKQPVPVLVELDSMVDIVAIGASTGGPPALQSIFSSFVESPPFTVVVSQHMPSGFTRAFSERLNRTSVLDVREAKDGDLIRPGMVLVAPGGRNLVFQVVRDEVVARVVEPSPSDRYVPSVDVMFASLAPIYGSRLFAVVLTGMGNDGSSGAKAVKSAGGYVLAEAEETAVVFGMPRAVVATGFVDKVVPLNRIVREICLRCGSVPHIY